MHDYNCNLVLEPFPQALAFTLAERERLGLKGLLPPAVRTQSLQAKAIMTNLRNFNNPINKYMYLRDLQDWNKKLFYRILCENTEEIMPVVYTPTVGEACQKYSMLYKRPRGLFITIQDAGNVEQILANWPEKEVKVNCRKLRTNLVRTRECVANPPSSSFKAIGAFEDS